MEHTRRLLDNHVNDTSDGYYLESDYVVIWSGGCDSTLLLYEVAERYSTKDRPVAAFSINHYLVNDKKTEKEKESREKILTELRARGLHVIHREITVTGDLSCYNYTGGMQSYIWLTSVLPYVKKDSTVYLGYMQDDDNSTFSLEQDMVKMMCRMLGKKVDLLAPYAIHDKEAINTRLMELDLYDLTWTCEMTTDGKRCGHCKPCKLQQKTILYMASKGHPKALTMLPKHVKIIKKYIPGNQKQLKGDSISDG